MEIQSSSAVAVLPPRYYLKYFADFLEHVDRLYGTLLTNSERTYLHDFERLSDDAKCLYVRLTTRKGQYFKESTLTYAELAPTPLARIIDELEHRGWAARVGAAQHFTPEQLMQFLDLFTKGEILDALGGSDQTFPFQARKLAKAELLVELPAWPDLAAFCKRLAQNQKVIKRERDDVLELFKFLYFGHIDGDFSPFILRDIGRLRFEERAAESLTPRFSDRDKLDETYSVAQAYREFKDAVGIDDPRLLLERFQAWRSWHHERFKHMGVEATGIFERWALRLGTLLEKAKSFHAALDVYRQTTIAPARERQIRLLKSLERNDEALELCQTVIDDPHGDAHEVDFARDELAKAGDRKITRATTRKLKGAETALIDLAQFGSPEEAAIAHYEALGMHATYTENYFWNSLFGLVFWDFIHSGASTYHFPLQVGPAPTQHPQFLLRQEAQLKAHLDALSDSNHFEHHIERLFAEKNGTVNSFVSWSAELVSELQTLYRCVGWAKLRAVLAEMAKNPYERGRGFPDLFVWGESQYFFAEIKSPRDKLSSYQLRWITFFDEIGLPAKILRIKTV